MLCDTLMVDTGYYAFVKNNSLYSTKSEFLGKL